jgi:chemosensory pili system protein ChpA (sensor histidine kinase/response regulator)
MGILTGDRAATPKELAQLIFQPGFSTRTTTNEIAGRGVGMDVVAHTLDRMHSWVEVESNPGQGTLVRLTVPLRSIIEHAMVFRAGEQLFAVPMQYIKNAGVEGEQDESESVCSLSRLMGIAESAGGNPTHLVIEAQPLLAADRQARDSRSTISKHKNDSRVVFQVDEILGPDEVVVRPLPPLFRHQAMFAGVTLSGLGQIVLVFDPRRLISLASQSQAEPAFYTENVTPAEQKKARILVVDDSLSARRGISLLLRKHGWETVEAVDGMAAVEQLDLEGFAAVFTDFDMPRMDGLQLIRTIRERPDLGGLPIVMISSRSAAELEDKAIGMGASSFLKKPITESNLREILSLIPDPNTRRNHS